MGLFTGATYNEAINGDLGSDINALDTTMFGLDTTIHGTTYLVGSSFDFDYAVLDNKTFNGSAANLRAPSQGDIVYFTLTASSVDQLSFSINNYSYGDPTIFQKEVSNGNGGSFTFSGSFIANSTPDYFSILGSSNNGEPLSYTLKLSSQPGVDYDLGLLLPGVIEIPDSKLGAYEQHTYAFHIDQPMTLFAHSEGDAGLRADFANLQPTLWPGNSYGSSVDIFDELEDNLMPGDYVLTYSTNGKALSESLSLRLVYDNAGNNAFWAHDLGKLVGGVTSDSRAGNPFVSRVDGLDYYSFTLTEPSAVAITLQTEGSMFGNGVRLVLDDADSLAAGVPTSGIPTGFQDILAPGAQQYIDMTTTAARSTPLPAGTYFFHVEGPTSSNFGEGDLNENYNVFVTAWADGAGNDPENAQALSLRTGISVNDMVNLADPDDYYHITVTNRGMLDLNVDIAGNGGADLQLLRFSPADQAMTVTAFALNQDYARTIAEVDPGDYYIRIFTNTKYPIIDTLGYDKELIYPDGNGAKYTLSASFDPLGSTDKANLSGGDGNDTIVGGKGNNALNGGGGNDYLVGSAGNDILDGGNGLDTVQYAAASTEYHVLHQPDGTMVAQKPHAEQDTLTSVERIEFTDGTLGFDVEGTAGQAYRLYQAAFDRVPDTEGLSYWIGRLDSGTTTLKAVADSFIHSPEFIRTYGTAETVNNAQYVELLYNHTLGRISDQDGFNYWVNRLDTSQTNRADLLAFFSESDENFARTEPDIHDGIWFA